MKIKSASNARGGTGAQEGATPPASLSVLPDLPALAAQHFKTTILPKLQGERVTEGQPSGSVWLVRIIEAGKSLNGPDYYASGLKKAAPIFEGAPAYSYAWGRKIGNADAAKQGHLDEKVKRLDGRGLVGNLVGRFEGVHWNEEAQALDAFLKVYDQDLREVMLNAWNLGDIGEGGQRDVLGLSIDAMGLRAADGIGVTEITSASSVDIVTCPAAGGRIRRLVAALAIAEEVDGPPIETLTEALEHNHKIADEEPEWDEVDKSKLPDSAFSDEAERTFPHHFVRDGVVGESGRYEDGDQFLHRGGLNAAWAASRGARSGEPASSEVTEHLLQHRKALGLDDEPGASQESTLKETIMTTPNTNRPASGLKENAGELASLLQAYSEKLASATDEEAIAMVGQIVSELSGYTAMEEGAPAVAPPSVAANALVREAQAKTRELQEGIRVLLGGKAVKENKKLAEALGKIAGVDVQEDEKDREIRGLKEALEKQAIAREMALHAGELGIHDPDAALKLVDMGGVRVSEDYQSVTGLKEALVSLIEAKTYLGPEGIKASIEAAQAAAGVVPPATPASAPATPAKPAAAVSAATPAAPALAAVSVSPAPVKEAVGQAVPLQESVAGDETIEGMTREALASRMSFLQRRATKAGCVRSASEWNRLNTLVNTLVNA